MPTPGSCWRTAAPFLVRACRYPSANYDPDPRRSRRRRDDPHRKVLARASIRERASGLSRSAPGSSVPLLADQEDGPGGDAAPEVRRLGARGHPNGPDSTSSRTRTDRARGRHPGVARKPVETANRPWNHSASRTDRAGPLLSQGRAVWGDLRADNASQRARYLLRRRSLSPLSLGRGPDALPRIVSSGGPRALRSPVRGSTCPATSPCTRRDLGAERLDLALERVDLALLGLHRGDRHARVAVEIHRIPVGRHRRARGDIEPAPSRSPRRRSGRPRCRGRSASRTSSRPRSPGACRAAACERPRPRRRQSMYHSYSIERGYCFSRSVSARQR